LIVILHWGDQFLPHRCQISSKDWKCKVKFKIEANQHHKENAELHSKKRWKVISEWERQREHMEGILQPLSNLFPKECRGSFSIHVCNYVRQGTNVLYIVWNNCSLCMIFKTTCTTIVMHGQNLFDSKIEGLILWVKIERSKL
jgi:hypothetical protein